MRFCFYNTYFVKGLPLFMLSAPLSALSPLWINLRNKFSQPFLHVSLLLDIRRIYIGRPGFIINLIPAAAFSCNLDEVSHTQFPQHRI